MPLQLEEFRKKKAAEKAKKAASTNQVQASEGVSEKQLSESECVRLVDFDAAGISDSVRATSLEPSGIVINNDIKETETSQKSSDSFSQDASSNPFASANNIDLNSEVPIPSHIQNKDFRGGNTSNISEQLNGHYSLPVKKETGRASESAPYRFPVDHSVDQLPSGTADSSSNQSGFHGISETLPHISDSNLNNHSVIKSSESSIYQNGLPENSGSILLHDKPGYRDRFYSSFPFSSYEGKCYCCLLLQLSISCCLLSPYQSTFISCRFLLYLLVCFLHVGC